MLKTVEVYKEWNIHVVRFGQKCTTKGTHRSVVEGDTDTDTGIKGEENSCGQNNLISGWDEVILE